MSPATLAGSAANSYASRIPVSYSVLDLRSLVLRPVPKLLEDNPLSAICDYRPVYGNRYPNKLSKYSDYNLFKILGYFVINRKEKKQTRKVNLRLPRGSNRISCDNFNFREVISATMARKMTRGGMDFGATASRNLASPARHRPLCHTRLAWFGLASLCSWYGTYNANTTRQFSINIAML